MREDIAARCLLEGQFVAENGATVRQAAAKFGVSKSLVHQDLRVRLRAVYPALHREVAAVLDKNKAERHVRGGEATRAKYTRVGNVSIK